MGPDDEPSDQPCSTVDTRPNDKGVAVEADHNLEDTQKVLGYSRMFVKCSKPQTEAIRTAVNVLRVKQENRDKELASNLAKRWGQLQYEEETGLAEAGQAALNVLQGAGTGMQNNELRRLAQASAEYNVHELPKESQVGIYLQAVQLC